MKLGMISLGCPKNLTDGEYMLGDLKNCGYEITSNVDDAVVIIVNTCGFINDAKEESINEILNCAEMKDKGKCQYLIVTGCLAQRYKAKILKLIPEVDAVLGTGSCHRITETVQDLISGKRTCIQEYGDINISTSHTARRMVSTGKSHAYLKIAEGCDNRCTYCIIPMLRGKYRSIPIEDLVSEAEYLIKQGIKEIIPVAQDVTNYGTDIYGEKKLPVLLRKLSKIKGEYRIRLLYCYPESVTDELISEIKNNDKICKYIDIPIQHASNKILKLMNRRTRKSDLESLMYKLRTAIPGIVIRTTVIVGFPGETDNDFDELFKFISKMRFERLGAFVYSREPGTPAYSFKPVVHHMTAKKRYKSLMLCQNEIYDNLSAGLIGSVREVIVEGVADDGIFYIGRSYGEAPDIDGYIYFTGRDNFSAGQIVNVKILEYTDSELIGDVVDEFTE